jgi:hypothetical protein
MAESFSPGIREFTDAFARADLSPHSLPSPQVHRWIEPQSADIVRFAISANWRIYGLLCAGPILYSQRMRFRQWTLILTLLTTRPSAVALELPQRIVELLLHLPRLQIAGMNTRPNATVHFSSNLPLSAHCSTYARHVPSLYQARLSTTSAERHLNCSY